MSEPVGDSNDRTRFDGLGSHAMIRINQYCDQFETAWQQTGQASLAEFIATVDQADQAIALPELLLIDLAFRQKLNLPMSAEMYLDNWKDLDREWLDKQLKLHRSTETGPDSVTGELTQLGDYRIEGKLGSGGMGQVYRATHKLMGRVVAIKVLKESRLTDLAAQRRFEREVRTIAKLSHPNIVSAFDAREDGGMLFLVTEYVEGEDFSKLVARKGALKPADAMYFVWQAAKGLKYAHGQGIVHRDIKPGNLLLEKKRTVKVLDLGLARLLDRGNPEDTFAEGLTKSEHIVGTASYMSPEQARSPLKADERSDIYSLGCTLFFLLVGQAPYRGDTYVDTILAHMESPTPELPESVKGRYMDPELRTLTARMIAKRAEDRPQSMDEVVDCLAEILKKIRNEQTSITDLPRSLLANQIPAASKKGYARTKLILPVALVSLVLLAVASPFVWRSWFANSASGGNTTGQENQNPPLVPATNDIPGLGFDGERSYVQVTGFEGPPAGPLRIEVAAIANRQMRPSNLVSWTGYRTLALFNNGRQWGIAYFDGTQSRLVVSRQPAQFNRLALICGEWDGNQLRLYIDGEEILSEPTAYGLDSTNPALFIGGVPEGFLQPGEVRFFDGSIYGVRISAGNLPAPAKSLDALVQLNTGTDAVFPFSERTGNETFDSSSRRWIGILHHTTWAIPISR